MEYTKEQYLDAMKRCIKEDGCSNCDLKPEVGCRDRLFKFALDYIDQLEKDHTRLSYNQKKLLDATIDDALSTNDKSISIFISKDGMASININPYKEEKPRWIIDEDVTGHVYGYVCSECGCSNRITTAFCPHCGEKLSVYIMDEVDGEQFNHCSNCGQKLDWRY